MFDDEVPKKEERADWTGTIIAAILAPVFFLFAYFDKAELGLTACMILGMSILAIKLRWKLRKEVWFWATIVFILALHVPLLFIVRWPQTSVPTIAYSLPFGIVDFLLITGALDLAQRLFSKGSYSDEGAE